MFRSLAKPALASAISFIFLLPLCAAAQQNRKPLTEAEVIDLLKNEVPSERVESLARQYGIAFQMNDQAESALLVAGATDELLATLREVAPKPPAEPPTLMIEVTPGGAQVFLDDELFARTSPEGRLKIVSLKPGPHKVRVSLDGFRDYEQELTLVAGQTATASTALQAVPKAGENSRIANGKGSASGTQPPTPAANSRPQRVIIPAGTVITVRMVDDVDSSRDKPGREFAARVDARITVAGQVVIPQDTDAHLRLLSVGNPSQPSLQIQLFTITLNGRNFNIPAAVYSKSAEPPKPAANSNSNARLGGILGAVVGGAAGRAIAGNSRRTNPSSVQAPPQTLSKETKIDFTLRGPMFVMQ
jgi:hypothetical protein